MGVAFCLLADCASARASALTPARKTGEIRHFWLKGESGYRQATTTLRAAGARSYIYVESGLPSRNITAKQVETIRFRLEESAPVGALLPNLGVIPLQEILFAPLPRLISEDDRVAVVVARITDNPYVDGYFSPFDQIPAARAESLGEKSNEGNIIYVNALERNETGILAVFAQELQKLISYPVSRGEDLWFRETLGKAAKLASGFYVDQSQLNEYAARPSLFPLVSRTYIQQGPQLLFASFLLDSMPDKVAGLRLLNAKAKNGREAVESLFRQVTGSPFTFDVIFSKYLSYVFAGAGGDLPAPLTPETGRLQFPVIEPYAEIKSFPAELTGDLMPYSVLAISLPSALPPTAVVKITTLRPKGRGGVCGRTATALWKPVDLKTIAIYSVGCDHESPDDRVQFHLTVLDKPSLISPNPLTITP